MLERMMMMMNEGGDGEATWLSYSFVRLGGQMLTWELAA